MKQTIDNFSTGSANYASFRPESPDSVFEFLYKNLNGFGTAWDCGTGNGQVAARLADRFDKVIATDISEEQLKLAQRKDNIEYRKERAEQTLIADASVDLITIAQAIHWFDFDSFYREVRRVARPGAIIAAWTYTLLHVDEAVDKVIGRLYWDISRPYWDKERDYVDAEYATIPFPFDELQSPVFSIEKQWDVEQLIGYLGTMSGLKHYANQTGTDPVALIKDDLVRAWGPERLKTITWPVCMRAGFVKSKIKN